MDSKTFFDNFEIIANAPGGIARLRELILDLAVRGKLTEQISNERRLEIPESDGFFVIPDNWVWSALEEIADYGGRGSKSPNEIVDADWVLDLEDIEKTTSRLLNRVRSKDRKTTSTKARFEKGDVLYGKLRPYLDKVLVADTPGYCTTEIVPITPKFGLDPQWLRISLKSPMFIGYVIEKSYGMKMPRLGTKDAKASLHAVPPIEEQKRIVAKVDELMALCDELEEVQNHRNAIRTASRKSAIDAISSASSPEELDVAWKRISGNWLTIADTPESISSLRSLILDLAVRGLFNRPGVKFQKVMMGDIFEVAGGLQKTPKRAPIRSHFPYLRVANVQRGRLDLSEISRFELSGDELDKYKLEAGDLLIVEGNGSEKEIGRCALWNGEIDNCIHQNHIIRCRPKFPEIEKFALLFLNSPSGIRLMKSLAVTTSGLFTLSVGKIRAIELQIPPATEISQIVNKVDELAGLCDQLHKLIITREEFAERYSSAISLTFAA